MKKIHVRVKASAKEDKIELLSENKYKVNVKASPIEGKANIAVISMLSDHFGVSKSNIELVRGFKGRDKVFLVKT